MLLQLWCKLGGVVLGETVLSDSFLRGNGVYEWKGDTFELPID